MEEKKQEGFEEEKKQDPQDLIKEYEDYLKLRKEQAMEIDEQASHMNPEEQDVKVPTFDQDLEKFDYIEQKMVIRELFQKWLSDEAEHRQSLELLTKFKNQTQQVTSTLCEQLRIVLEP